METAKVFISSILNPKTEDLRAERETVRSAVESYRFLNAWVFERAPASFEDLDESYLRHVDECDLFVLIVGKQATNPVSAELQRAKDRKKPILVFSKVTADRTPLAQALIDSAGVKYASFRTADELRQAATDAVDQVLISGLRSLSDRTLNRIVLVQLRQLAEKYTQVRVKPVIPAQFETDTFMVRECDVDVTALIKMSSEQTIHIPTRRISEVLLLGPLDPPLLVLDGRLQLVSSSYRSSWKFFDETPDSGSTWGFSKTSSVTDPRPNEIMQSQQGQHFTFHWGALAEAGRRSQDGWEIVYDDDGRYFRIPDRVGDLVFMRKRA
jgi:hypothetical protein